MTNKQKIIYFIFVVTFLFFNFFLIAKRFFNDQSRFFNDFPSYYVGSYLFWHNQSPYDLKGEFTKTAHQLNLNFLYGLGFTYPPLITFLFYPLLSFSPYQAARIFAGINMIGYLIFGYLIFKEYQKTTGLKLFFMALFLANYLPAVESANHGQVNIIVLICLYFYYLFRKKPKLSSLFLTIAFFIKVYPIFFLLKEILSKRFKFIFYHLVWVIVISFVLSLAGGFNLLIEYFTKVLPSMNNSLDSYYTNQSINGFLSRALLNSNKTYLISQPIYQVILTLVLILVLLMLVRVTIKWKGESKGLFLLWLGTIILLAGKNSFSNFAPSVLLGIYLIDNFHRLNNWYRALFVSSVLISNFLWSRVYFFNKSFVLLNHPFSKIIYVTITSLGFLSLLIQILAIHFLNKKSS